MSTSLFPQKRIAPPGAALSEAGRFVSHRRGGVAVLGPGSCGEEGGGEVAWGGFFRCFLWFWKCLFGGLNRFCCVF